LTETHGAAGGAAHTSEQAAASQAPPSEEDLRAAYEAELNRITSSEMIIQTAVSLLNIGGRRLGLAAGSQAERDLDQVRDAIDGVRALMPILERHMSSELVPLRDALAQLQMAYAREAGSKPSERQAEKAEQAPAAEEGADQKGPGPAESSGRLWVPGR
jgi:hypothetical protein